ncbi:MAG: putative oxidoreductase YcjS [candidate division BRC1 bacterium ADurb.BinA364]|nr:MAG: putative oxidoreductase YcjS [candidate division BRC1 bacterium ADurb.BinA364]
MTVKAAFVGSGGIASVHMKGMSQNKGFQVAACCDLMAERAKDFAQKWGIPRHYSDMDRMLETEDIDAVLVCTPNYAHMAPTIKALSQGLHVYCEKPMAMNVAEAQAMADAARNSKALLTIGHHQRFSPANMYIHKTQAAGDLGEVYFGRTVYRRRAGVPWWGAFHIKEKSGGGALIDIGVHVIDLALWLMGSPKPVRVVGQTYARMARQTDGQRPNQNPAKAGEFDVDDFASAYVKMDNGATLAIECSWNANQGPKAENRVELYGDRGGATTDPFAIYAARHGEFVNILPQFLPQIDAHAAATEHFRKAIEGEAEILVKPEETVNVQKILDGIYRSSTTGEEVVYS